MRTMLIAIQLIVSTLGMSQGHEVGGNGNRVPGWIKSIGFEIARYIEKRKSEGNALVGISVDDFRGAVESMEPFLITKLNRGLLESQIGILKQEADIRVVPIKVGVNEKGEPVYRTLALFDGEIWTDLYNRNRKEYRDVAHVVVMVAGKDDKNNKITGAWDLGDLEKQSPQYENVSTPPETIEPNGIQVSLNQYQMMHSKCLVEDGKRKGPMTQLFRQIFPSTAGDTLTLTDGHAPPQMRWFERWVLTSPHIINEKGSILTHGKVLRFQMGDFLWTDHLIAAVPGDGRRRFSVRSDRPLAQIKYFEKLKAFTIDGFLDEQKTMVRGLEIVNAEEKFSKTVQFINRQDGGPTPYSANTSDYEECLNEALNELR